MTPSWPMAIVWGAWLAFLGAAIGSFLNVVVYRLPRGLSLVHPGSHCPRCGHAIRWYDNVPVLGWLLLRGRCRDCRQPIAARYPLVEASVGAIFLLLAAVELTPLGGDLPTGAWSPLLGEAELAPPTAILLFAYHAWLMCALVAAGLIEWDRWEPPARLWTLSLALGLAAPLWRPELRPLAIGPTIDFATPLAAGLAAGVTGLLLGLLLGLAASLGEYGLGRRAHRRWGLVGAWTLVGAFLGWQGALIVAAATTLARVALTVVSRGSAAARRRAPTLACAAATLLLIVAWRPVADRLAMAAWTPHAGLILAAAAGLFAGAWWTASLSAPEEPRPGDHAPPRSPPPPRRRKSPRRARR